MPDWKYKLDSYGRLLLENVSATQEVDALIRLAAPLDALGRQALMDAGAAIHTESGEILTARLAVSALEKIAGLGFVRRIGVSRPLHPE